jgi:hypothetical protein
MAAGSSDPGGSLQLGFLRGETARQLLWRGVLDIKLIAVGAYLVGARS